MRIFRSTVSAASRAAVLLPMAIASGGESVSASIARTSALPPLFVPNHGQWPDVARFVARGSRQAVTVVDDGFLLRCAADGAGASASIGFTFEGAAGRAAGDTESAARANDFLARDPALWRTGLPTFESVVVDGLPCGGSARMFIAESGIEFDVVLPPGAVADAVVMRCEGASEMSLAGDGALRMRVASGEFVLTIPETFAVASDGTRRPLAARFRVLSRDRFSFETDARDTGESLVVDPALTYASFLGGTNYDEIRGLGVDLSCSALATGWTLSPLFPVTGGAFDTSFNGSRDAFVSKLGDTGSSVAWVTFLGGVDNDEGVAIAADPFGAVVVAGRTRSPNYPVTAGAFDLTPNGGEDVFVTALTASGGALDYSTLIGGEGDDVPAGIDYTSGGGVIVAGFTDSAAFPATVGSFDVTANGGQDVFVARLTDDGDALDYATYLGGGQDDVAFGLASRNFPLTGDNAFVAGMTASAEFPTTGGAFDTIYDDGGRDGFALRLNGAGASLLYSSFLGGSSFDAVTAIAVDLGGAATVAGETWSPDFPVTAGAAQSTHAGGIADAFVARIAATGTALDYSTYLGGGGVDFAQAVALDSTVVPRIAGATSSTDFPITGDAAQPAYGGGATDAFVTRVSAAGSAILSSSYFGGSGPDVINALRVDCVGSTIAAGGTNSGDAPVTGGSFDSTFNGFEDAFVLKMPKTTSTCGASPTSATYGAGKPGTNGIPTLTALVPPAVPTKVFTIRAGNGLPGAVPLLFIGASPLSLPFDGGALLVNPIFFIFLLPFDGTGKSDGFGPICDEPSYCGATVYMQVMFADPGATGFYQSAQTKGLSLTLGS